MTFTATTTDTLAELPFTAEFAEFGIKWLRVANTEAEQAMVLELVEQCIGRIEEYCRQPIFGRSYVISLTGFENGRLPGTIVTGVSVHYKTDIEAETFTVLSSTLYTLNDEAEICFGDVPEGVVAVEIRYTGGYTDTIPGGIRTALIWQLSDLYDNRSDGKREVPQKSEVYLNAHRLSLL